MEYVNLSYEVGKTPKKFGWSYLAEQFRRIKHSLAEQFRQIKRSLAEQFRQIKRSLAEHLLPKNTFE